MLRSRSMVALTASEVISSLGSLMTVVALPWFVLETTGSPEQMGLVLAAEGAPLALFAIPSSRLAGRLGARRTLLLCDAVWVPAVAAIPVLHYAGALSFGLLLGLAFVAPRCRARRDPPWRVGSRRGGRERGGIPAGAVTRVRAETLTVSSALVLGGGFVALLLAGPALESLGAAAVFGGVAATQTAAAALVVRLALRPGGVRVGERRADGALGQGGSDFRGSLWSA